MRPAKPFPELSTSRLQLKEITVDCLVDFQGIAYFEGEPVKYSKKVIELIHSLKRDFDHNKGISWGLFSNNQLIGSCGFYRGFKDQIGEIGYVLHERFWSKGYMKEACLKVLEYGFEELKLKEITAYTKDSNLPSIRLLFGLGFSKEEEFVKDYRKYSLRK